MKPLFLVPFFFCIVFVGLAQKKPRVKPIHSDILTSLEGPVVKGQQQFIFRLSTDEIYECSNVSISADWKMEGNKVSVTVNGVIHPEVCLTALGPATVALNLTELPLGEYDFKARYRNYDPLKATLFVSESTWKFVIKEEALITLQKPILRRIPAQTVWGSLKYSEGSREQAQNFLADLENEQCSLTELKPGDYGAFYLREVGNQTERKVGERFELPFLYHYEGDFERLNLLVGMYQEKFGEDLKISIYKHLVIN